MRYEFDTVIEKPEKTSGAFVVVPYDLKKEFGTGRLKVKAWFDGAYLPRIHRLHGWEVHFGDPEHHSEENWEGTRGSGACRL